jgi:hypothetical protein
MGKGGEGVWKRPEEAGTAVGKTMGSGGGNGSQAAESGAGRRAQRGRSFERWCQADAGERAKKTRRGCASWEREGRLGGRSGLSGLGALPAPVDHRGGEPEPAGDGGVGGRLGDDGELVGAEVGLA